MKASSLAEALVAILILSILLPPVYLLLRQSRVGKDRLRITEAFWSAAEKYLDQQSLTGGELADQGRVHQIESIKGEGFRVEVTPRFQEEELILSFIADSSAIRGKKIILKDLPTASETREPGP